MECVRAVCSGEGVRGVCSVCSVCIAEGVRDVLRAA